jgi:Domain of unknown function (DUF6265)
VASRVAAVLMAAAVLWPAPAGLVLAQSRSATSLAWMAGSWSGRDGADDHEEHWTAPRGGALVGMHRTVRDGRMVEFEFIRIEERDGTLAYVSMPGGKSPATVFTLKSIDGERVMFENLAHDFPQRIIYWKAAGDLGARIEGNLNGKASSMEWRWGRSSLTP